MAERIGFCTCNLGTPSLCCSWICSWYTRAQIFCQACKIANWFTSYQLGFLTMLLDLPQVNLTSFWASRAIFLGHEVAKRATRGWPSFRAILNQTKGCFFSSLPCYVPSKLFISLSMKSPKRDETNNPLFMSPNIQWCLEFNLACSLHLLLQAWSWTSV